MLAILSYVLAIGIAAVAVAGVINGKGDEAVGAAFSHAGLVFPIVALCVLLWRVSRAPSKKSVGLHWFLWPVAMVLLSRTLFANDVEGMQGVYSVLLTIAVAMPALVRADFGWGAVFLFSALFYTGQVVMEERERITTPDIVSFQLSFYLDLLEFWGTSLVAGLIPWWILKKRTEIQEREFNATLEEVRDRAMSGAMARAKDVVAAQQDPSKRKGTDTGIVVPRGSGVLRIEDTASATDTIALLNVGGKGVNEQLESMLFFMRSNFKGLTAGAFIYDPVKNVLVLNCYNTKDGVQIVDNAQIPVGVGVIGQAASGNKFFMSGDLSLYQGGGLSYYAKDEGVCSMLAVPIVVKSGDDDDNKEFLGVLAVDSINRNAFTDHDRDLMLRFAKIAAALIANIRMSVSLEHSSKTFRAFYEVSHSFSVALKLDDVFKVMLDRLPKIFPSCSRLIIVWYDFEKNVLRLRNICGAGGELSEGMEFPATSGGIYSYAFNKSSPVNIGDFQAQRSYRFVPEEPQNPLIRSLMVIPIIAGEERRCVGLFSAESATPGLFKPELEQVLNTIVENASVAITRSMLYMKMEKLATTDGLTGLNNHRTFQEIAAREFDRAKRYGRPLSMLLTDIDHFKNFNDTYGHPVGDLVLREIAGCIRSSVRANDYPARYGGEEFAVVLPETAEQGAMAIAERIRQTVEARVIESGKNMLRVTISIGCVTFPTYGTTQQEVIDCADKALYASKKGGRNRVTLYNPSMTVSSK